jgi:hypothetical protein
MAILKIFLLSHAMARHVSEKGDQVTVKFFSRKSRAIRNWHNRAMMIDPKKTKLVFLGNEEIKNVPSWVYKEFTKKKPDEEEM